MSEFENVAFGAGHDHVFLGAAHGQNERRTWTVIALCTAMMIAEIVGGTLFGSLALVADGLHMSTHAGAMLIAALAYTYARRHASDARFVFGTGKLGDLAGFTSAIVLAMIALLIAYEAIARFLSPVPIHFDEAIPIAVLGLLVNLASVWLLSGDHHGHAAHHAHGDEAQTISTGAGVFAVSIFEDGVPPVFRISPAAKQACIAGARATITTIRADGSHQTFDMAERGDWLESIDAIPEPHAFTAIVRLHGSEHSLTFVEHEHAHHHGHGGSKDVTARDHNIRSAYIHVIADAAVSVLAIVGLVLARVRLDVDGPARGHRRRARDRELVVRPDARYGPHPPRRQSGHPPRRQCAPLDRKRRRSRHRSACMASGPRPHERRRVRRDGRSGARLALLPPVVEALHEFVARDRGSALPRLTRK